MEETWEDLEAGAYEPQTDPNNNPYFGTMSNGGLPGYETSVYDIQDGVWKQSLPPAPAEGQPSPPAKGGPEPDRNCYILDLPHNVRDMIAQKAADMTFTDGKKYNMHQWSVHMRPYSKRNVAEFGGLETIGAFELLATVCSLHVQKILEIIGQMKWAWPRRVDAMERKFKHLSTSLKVSHLREDDKAFLEIYQVWQASRADLVGLLDEITAMPSAWARELAYHIDEIDRQFRRVWKMAEGLSPEEGDYLPVFAARKSRADLMVLSTKEERSQNKRKLLKYEWTPKRNQRIFVIGADGGRIPGNKIASGRYSVAELLPEVVEHFQRLAPKGVKLNDEWKTIMYYESYEEGNHGQRMWSPSFRMLPRR